MVNKKAQLRQFKKMAARANKAEKIIRNYDLSGSKAGRSVVKEVRRHLASTGTVPERLFNRLRRVAGPDVGMLFRNIKRALSRCRGEADTRILQGEYNRLKSYEGMMDQDQIEDLELLSRSAQVMMICCDILEREGELSKWERSFIPRILERASYNLPLPGRHFVQLERAMERLGVMP